MKLAYAVALVLSLLALIWALGLPQAPRPVVSDPEPTIAAAAPAGGDLPAPADRDWPALFGEAEPAPAPQAPPPAAAPAPPPLPELVLRGVLVGEEQRLAILGVDGEGRVVREGETLAPGVEVLRIELDGIEVSTAAGPLRVDFPDTPAGGTPPPVRREVPVPTVSGVPAVAGLRGLTDGDLEAILDAVGVPGGVLPK